MSKSNNKKKLNWDLFIPTDTEFIEPIIIDGIVTSYLASSKGYIINTDYRMSGKSCILKESTNRYGYKTVCLYVNKIRKTYKVHRLIAIAFMPNPYNLKEVNHINGDKNDNSVDNLEWSDRTHNMRHAVATGLHRVLYGKENPNTIYPDEKIHEVCQYMEKGTYSIKEISQKTGVGYSTIRNLLQGGRKDIAIQYDLSHYRPGELAHKKLRVYTDYQIHRVCKELVKKELLLYEIAEMTGVSYTVVKRIKARKYKPYAYIYDKYDYHY